MQLSCCPPSLPLRAAQGCVCGPYLPHAAHHHSSLWSCTEGDLQDSPPLLAKPQLWPLFNFLLAVGPSSHAREGFKNAFSLFFTLQHRLVPSCAPQLAACLALFGLHVVSTSAVLLTPCIPSTPHLCQGKGLRVHHPFESSLFENECPKMTCQTCSGVVR